MRYRLMATYRGVPYEVGVGPSSSDVVLFAACPPPEELGFEPATGHWRKHVIRAEIDALWESRPVGIFRGEPCIVLDDLGERMHIAYLGTDPERAANLGYWQVDRGVFELLTPRDEVTGLTEERVTKPLRWDENDAAVAAVPSYPYGTAPWPVLGSQSPVPAPREPSPGPAVSPAPAVPRAAPAPAAAATAAPAAPEAASPGLATPVPVPGPAGFPGPQDFPAQPGPAGPPDFPAQPGLSGPPDFALPPDFPGQPGLSGPPDFPGPPDLPVPPDFPVPPDLSGPQDFAVPPGLADPAGAAPGNGYPTDGGSRAARRQRVPTREIFCELADLASIPRAAYSLEAETDGAMCLLATPEGFEVFIAADGARHEVRSFAEEEAAYFCLFGVLAAEAIRSGALAPTVAAAGLPDGRI